MTVPGSVRLFDSLADDYDAHFQVPHRRAYDDLTWEFVAPLLPSAPGVVIDAGCGTGRWATRLLELGHHVIGIEQAPRMAAVARQALAGPRFDLYAASMEDCELVPGLADLVLALGSVQYTRDPALMIERFARWARPGGSVAVLVDSVVALVLELIAAGKSDEAIKRLASRRGLWGDGEHAAEMHLFDRDGLLAVLHRAGLEDVRVHGLLVGSSALGRQGLTRALTEAREAHLELERQLAQVPLIADCGKQLLGIGTRPE